MTALIGAETGLATSTVLCVLKDDHHLRQPSDRAAQTILTGKYGLKQRRQRMIDRWPFARYFHQLGANTVASGGARTSLLAPCARRRSNQHANMISTTGASGIQTTPATIIVTGSIQTSESNSRWSRMVLSARWRSSATTKPNTTMS